MATTDRWRIPPGSSLDLSALDKTELRELILDAWRMCVPKKVATEYFGE